MRIARDPVHGARPGGWVSPRRKRANIMSEDGSTLLWKFSDKSDNVQQQSTEAEATKTDENSPWKVDWNIDGKNGGNSGSKGGTTLWKTSDWDASFGGWESFSKDTPDGNCKTNVLQSTWRSGGSASVAQLSSFFDTVDARDDSTLPTAWADLKASDTDTSTWSTFPGGNTQQRSQNEGASINKSARNRPISQSTRSGFEKEWAAADMLTKDTAGTTTTRVEGNKDNVFEKGPATTTTGGSTSFEPGKDIRSDTETSNRSIRAKKTTSEKTRKQREAVNSIYIGESTNPFNDELLNDSFEREMTTNTTSGKSTNPFNDELLNDSFEREMTNNTTSKSTNPFDDNELQGGSLEHDMTNTNSKSKNPFDKTESLEDALDERTPSNTRKTTSPFGEEFMDDSFERDMTNTTSGKSSNPFEDDEFQDGPLEKNITNPISKTTNPFDDNEPRDDALGKDISSTTGKTTNPFGEDPLEDSLEKVVVGTLRSSRNNKSRAKNKSIDAKQKQSLSAKMCESMPPKALRGNKPQWDDISSPAPPDRSVDRRKALKQLKEGTSDSSQLGENISGQFHWSSRKLSGELGDEQAGREIAEIDYVLRASLALHAQMEDLETKTASKKTLHEVAASDTAAELKEQQQQQRPGLSVFEGGDAMNSLLTLNYRSTEAECKAQLNLLLLGRYIIGTTPLGRNAFDVGGKYRFATREELKATHDMLTGTDDTSSIFGTKQNMLRVAIKATLDAPEAADGSLSDSIVYTAIVSSHAEGNESYEKRCVISRVRHMLQFMGPDQLTVRDILRLMAWSRNSDSHVNTADGDRGHNRDEESPSERDRLNELLFEELRQRIRCQVRKWLGKTSWGSEGNPLRCDSEGRIVSNYPEDILFVVNVEMDVARGSLSHASQMEVMIDILIEFKESLVGMRRALSEEWEDMEIEWLCSVINDSATMMDYVETYSIFGDAKQHPVPPTLELKKVRDDVVKGYREVSREATDLVAYSIMKDVQEPVMDKVFTTKWEKNGEVMKCVAATLRDYYNDLLEWLPRYEYSCVVKKCIDVLVEEYMSAAFAEKHEGRRFFDADAVPARLIQDRLVLLDFFSMVEVEMKGRGARRRAKEALNIFLVLSDIIEAEDPEEVADEINTFCELLGTKYGQAAIMHAQVRKTGPYDHEAHEMWDEGLYMVIKKENEQCRLDVDLDHLLDVRETSSFPFSYSGSRTVDTYTTTGTLEGVDSDTTLPTRSGCYSRTRRHEDDDGDGCNGTGAWKERCADAVDKVMTVSADGCCWALDTTLELCNELRRHVFGKEGEMENTEDTQGDDNVFMSAATEDGADGIDDSDDDESKGGKIKDLAIDGKAEKEDGKSTKKKLLKSPRKWMKKMNFGS